MKIGFLWNFIRVPKHFNIGILYEVLNPIFESLENVETEGWQYTVTDTNCFFSKQNSLSFTPWFKYQAENADLAGKDLAGFIFNKDIIIGMELSPALCRILREKGKIYINFFNAPQRFTSDLLWYITTNSMEIAARMKKWDIYDDSYFEKNANILKLLCAGRVAIQKEYVLPDTVMIAGQTKQDSSVFTLDGFRKLLDYKKEIKQIIGERNVIIIPHPQETSHESLYKLLKYLGKGVISNDNSYTCLCNDNITAVITLSSSIGVEAKYFKKNVYSLLGQALKPGSSMILKKDYECTLGHEILKKQFWSEVFQEKKTYENEEYESKEIPKDIFRKLIGGWAYNDLLGDLTTYNLNNTSLIKFGKFNKREKIYGKNYDVTLITLSGNLDVINLSLPEHMFFYSEKGLSNIEKDGRWTTANDVQLEVFLPWYEEKKNISVSFCPFFARNVNEHLISVKTNDINIGSWKVCHGCGYKLLLPIDLFKTKHKIKIDININNLFSPFELGESADKRKLGLKIHKLEYNGEDYCKGKALLMAYISDAENPVTILNEEEHRNSEALLVANSGVEESMNIPNNGDKKS